MAKLRQFFWCKNAPFFGLLSPSFAEGPGPLHVNSLNSLFSRTSCSEIDPAHVPNLQLRRILSGQTAC
jgi:hypothetical protein